jgi:hypothetical protein
MSSLTLLHPLKGTSSHRPRGDSTEMDRRSTSLQHAGLGLVHQLPRLAGCDLLLLCHGRELRGAIPDAPTGVADGRRWSWSGRSCRRSQRSMRKVAEGQMSRPRRTAFWKPMRGRVASVRVID